MMKTRYYLWFCLILFALLIAGCGNGGAGLNGAVTVTGSQAVSTDSSDVSFVVSYTNPTETNLIGVKMNFTVTLDGLSVDSGSFNTNNSGTEILGPYTVPRIPSEQKVRCVATSDNLSGNSVVTVAKLGALVVTPATQTFASTDGVDTTKTFTVSGGTSPYSASSNNTGFVTTTVSGTTVIATRKSASTGTVTITVSDSAGSSVPVQVTLQ
jgi:hypothetical protein